MNQKIYRLIFDANRGMHVPAAEGVRTRGRAPRSRLRRLAALLAAMGGLHSVAFAVGTMPSTAALTQARTAAGLASAPLPVRSGNFNQSGSATVSTPDSRNMVVNQADKKVILNWDSFDIAKGYSVQFVQPDGGSALNRINSADPSLIMGNLKANGEVLLYNANGVIFGPGARVDTASFVATSLNVADSLFNKGFRGVADGTPAFGGDDANPNGFIRIERGAEIRAAAGGQVLMFAPRILNEGRLEAPKGQVGLAAGQKVYLSSSLNVAERGLLIEVDPFENPAVSGINTVENAKSGNYWVYLGYVDGNGNTLSQAQLPTDLSEAQRARLFSEKKLDYWVDGSGRTVTEATLAALTETARAKLVADGKLVSRTLSEKSETLSNDEYAALTESQRKQYVAENRLVQRINEIVTERGSTTMVGLAVRQMGTVRATTAVKGQNGGVYLLAHGKTTAILNTATEIGNDFVRVAEKLGDLVVGEGSVTAVTPVTLASETQLDAESFHPSLVRAEGQNILIGSKAVVQATGGKIEVNASVTPRNSPLFVGADTGVADASRIVVSPEALLDVSGISGLELDMSRNQMSGRLFAINLADSPLQRSGVLYRKNILFDAREGVEVANVTEFYNLIARSAAEKSTAGGTIALQADGAVVVGSGATLNVSGGSVHYAKGTIATTLVRAGSRIYEITDAPKDIVYDEILDVQRVRQAQAYTEGKNAGAVSIAGRQVVLQGSIVGRTSPGRYQRGDFARPASGETVAAFNAHRLRPLSGGLLLGRNDSGGGIDHYVSDITLTKDAGTTLPDGFWADPAGAPLSGLGSTVLLRQDMLAGNVGRLELRANGSIVQQASTGMDLGSYGQFVARAGRVDIRGSVAAASGSIDLEALPTTGSGTVASEVVLGPGATLDAAGRWVNDRARSANAESDIAIKGGSVRIASLDGVDIGEGAFVDVSAGAWRDTSRRISYGKAGSISIRHTIPNANLAINPWSLALNGSLTGYGFTGGGSLSLSVPDLVVSATQPAGGFWLNPEFFSAGGFRNIAIVSIHDVRFADGVWLAPVLHNRILSPYASATAPGGRVSSALYALDVLPETDRDAVNLTVLATLTPNVATGEAGASVVVGKGAAIETEGGGKLVLATGRSIVVDGTLSAPGGSISLNIGGIYRDASDNVIADIPATRGGPNAAEGDPAGFLADQAIYLTNNAQLRARGILKSETSASGRVTGMLLDGGVISLNARRGYVVAEAGSVIDVQGVDGALNLYVNRTQVQRLHGNAGSVSVQSPEGIYMDSSFLAGTANAHATRGTLSMTLTRNGLDNFGFGAPYSGEERRIELTNAPWVADAAGAARRNLEAGLSKIAGSGGTIGTQMPVIPDLDAALGNGAIRVSAPRISDARFDTVKMLADDRLVLDESVSLAAVRSLQLYATNIEARGNVHGVLEALHVALGDPGIKQVAAGGLKTVAEPLSVPAAAGQSSSLLVKAGVIDIIGRMGLSGLQMTTLDASLNGRTDGEIRLQGRLLTDATTDNVLAGSLLFADDLIMHAGQVYPTTMSRFSVIGRPGTSSLTFSSPVIDAGDSAPNTPLSAFASLTVEADRIGFTGRDDSSKGGVLRVPFGSLAVKAAQSITLSSGAELSASGDGVTVPVGTTVNGRDWLYSSGGIDSTKEAVKLNTSPVAKELRLEAPRLEISPDAKVSVAGGGDLQAWEFLSGAQGTTDTLQRNGLYAIVPGYRFDFAPVDAEIVAEGGMPAIGSRIVIPAGVAGLAAGEYTLLPARYALLAGGFVVSATSAGRFDGMAPIVQDDQSMIVSAYTRMAGSDVREDAYRRYLIEPGQTFLAKSGYTLTSGSDYYADRAERLDTPVPRLPLDAGRISLISTNPFDWRAALDLSAVRDVKGNLVGRAGQLDLSMSSLAVVDGNDVAPTGYAAVSAQSLSGSGAESILLGGYRSGTDTALTITTTAANVQVLANDQVLEANELLFVAKSRLVIGDGVSIMSAGTQRVADRTISLTGDGAFLRVGNAAGSAVSRTGASLAGGDITIGSGVLLYGPEVQIDATGRYTLAIDDESLGTRAPSFSQKRATSAAPLNPSSISIGASRVALGGASPEGDALRLEGSLLASLRAASNVALRSYTSIDFATGASLTGTGAKGFDRLVLDAPALRSLGAAGSAVGVAAADVLLTNTSGLTLVAGGHGTLEVTALPPLRESSTGGLVIGPGAMSLGFDTTTLKSTGDIVFQGKSSLGSSGDMVLAASRVSAKTGADAAISAAGGMTVNRVEDGHTLSEQAGVGARLQFSAASIEQAGHIQAAGGDISFSATAAGDGVTFAEGSLTEARGFATQTSDGKNYYGNAGSVTATSTAGSVTVNGAIDVSAQRDGGDGGTLSLLAGAGSVHFGEDARLAGGAGTAGDGGRFVLDASTLETAGNSSIDHVAAILEAGDATGAAGARAGGFTHEVAVRIRTGNVTFDNGTIRADSVTLAADGGAMSLGSAAQVDASAKQGGVVGVYAKENLAVNAGAVISARSSRAGANGGDITLSSSSGRISLASGAVIDAGGDDSTDGRITLRASRAGNTVNVDPVRASWNAGTLAVEAVRQYSGTTVATGSSAGTTIGQTTLAADTSGYMANKAAIMNALGLSGDARAHLRAGVEIRSSGDLTVSSDWNLWSASRAGGEPGYLSLRAAGNLNINGSISDGFNTVARTAALQTGDSWSYRLVAGADLGAANMMQTRSDQTGDLTVAGNKLIRTGTGSIEMAAGRDIALRTASNTPAVVYVAGTKVTPPADFITPDGAVFSERGGRLSLNAGRDIGSAASNQLINNWLFRTGRMDTGTSTFNETSYLAWWSRFDLYKQGVGSFGGGNVVVNAGRSISDLSVVAPTSAYLASAVADVSKLVTLGGGDIDIRAGADVRGGSYMLGRGVGSIRAGDAIAGGASLSTAIGSVAPVLGLMDGQWRLAARGDLSVGGVFNPTMFSMTRGADQNAGAIYSTYGRNAGIDIASAAGNVSWITPNLSGIAVAPTGTTEDLNYLSDEILFNFAPAWVQVVAHSGNVSILPGGGLALAPSADGNLQIYADGNISIKGSMHVLDWDPATLPGLTSTVPFTLRDTVRRKLNNRVFTTAGAFTALHAADTAPVRVQAGGDIVMSGATTDLWSPKQAVVTAGGQITNLEFAGQHHRSTDVTTIKAGGAILNDLATTKRGLISLSGPGMLELDAGRQVDLGTSGGIQTVGNLYNPTLPDAGANVSIIAGSKATLDLNAFRARYLESTTEPDSATYRHDLVTYVDAVLGLDAPAGSVTDAQYAQAINRFEAFSASHQVAFAKQVIRQEFARAYVAEGAAYGSAWQAEAAKAGVDQAVLSGAVFERFMRTVMLDELAKHGAVGSVATSLAARNAAYDAGYRAIDLAAFGGPFLFANADIDLVESKVHTQRGGDISFYSPGGGVNVGLGANAVAAVVGRAQKPESDRGIVAFNGGSIRSFSDSDFQVNTQKVFVIGQGDILLWSSNGNIDSGRGSNNTVTVPAVVPTVDRDGNIVFKIPPLATGSGIGILEPQDGRAEGTVRLYAPRGEIIALDASIRGPEINLGAEVVRGADNIIGATTGTTAAPVAVSVGALGAVAAQGESRSAAGQSLDESEKKAEAGRDRNSLLTVELVGLGEDVTASGCSVDEPDCRERTSRRN